MAFTTQIQLGTKGYLDISQDVPVPLNFSVAEIQDISKRQGGFSKTIELPGTANNNNLFSNLFDVNITDTTFNPNIRERVIILQNGVPVFEGNLQLLNVKKRNHAQDNIDEIVTYQVAVKDNTGDFYSSLNEKFLEDLGNWDNLNHPYNLASILATSANTSNDVYKYFLTKHGNQDNYYYIKDFQPAIFAKAYWDRIFLEAGYTYQWSGLTDNFFDKLVIPYNGEQPLINKGPLTFKAGFNTSQVFGYVNSTPQNLIIFNNDTTNGYFDGSEDNYNPSTGYYLTNNFIESVEFKTRYEFKVSLYFPVDTFFANKFTNIQTLAFNQPAIFNVKRSLSFRLDHFFGSFNPYITPTQNQTFLYESLNNYFFETTVTTDLSGNFPPGTDFGITIPAGTTVLFTGVSPEFSTTIANITPGFNITNWINSIVDIIGNIQDNTTNDTILQGSPNFPHIQVEVGLNPTASNAQSYNYFTVSPKGNLDTNQTVEVQQFIPRKIKQKDFISSIVKMYNLYIRSDKDNDKRLIVDTRDEFYAGGKQLDWTNKLAIDNEVDIKFLPDLQDKKILFSYKPDTDEANKTYTQQTNEVFGQLEYTFSNEFVKNTKLVQPMFSPTPLVKNQSGQIIPSILSVSPKNNIRILYDGGWIDTEADGYWKFIDYSTNSAGDPVSIYKYPYMGHLDNPITPDIDINFGLWDAYYYDEFQNVTDNNLYNRYYKRFISQIEAGKLMTAKFRINEYDILNLDFRDQIFINDAYWYLNKISDYNGNSSEGLTTVELILVDEGIKFSPSKTSFKDWVLVRPRPGVIKFNGTVTKFINDSKYDVNTFGNSTVWIDVLGSGNVVQANSRNDMVIGNNNNIGGNKNLVLGDNNIIQGNSNAILGRDDITVRGDNLVVAAGTFVQFANKIDAGRNIVLSQFGSAKPITNLNGGRNLIRSYYSFSLEQQVSAGRNTIL
jgi:hypothetical protein